jgi:benzoylformate decarboxylase
MKGSDILLEVLRTEGVRHIFGNPGTTELPLIDALAGADDLEYVLALQEASVVAMADGYAQVTGRPAFVNLHTSAGLGNGIGNMTNAQANGTPLVVTAGQQDRRHLHHDPLLAGDLVGIARATTKWADEVHQVGALGTILRRAFQDAGTAPMGPTFVSLPMDMLEEETPERLRPRSAIDHRTIPHPDLLATLAARLIGAERLAIVAGDEVAHSPGGVEALVGVADRLGCSVYGSPLHSNVVFPTTHPLWVQGLPFSADLIAKTLAQHDVVLLVGGRAFMVYPWSEGPAVPESVELIHLSPDAHQLGRVWPVALGMSGDPASSLAALLPHLGEPVSLVQAEQERAERVGTFSQKVLARYGEVPMPPSAAVHSLLASLPDDVLLVDEAITTGTYVRGFHHTSRPGRYFYCRGGGLGWGMPAACGVALASAGEPVLCIVGDGSAMYSPQALWTAAKRNLPVIFAVADNRQYLILKGFLQRMEGEARKTGRYIAMDLDEPPIDFVALAGSMGVKATRVECATDVGDVVRECVGRGGPHLLHLPISS